MLQESAGTKIRSFATIYKVIGIIASILMAISTWFTGCDHSSYLTKAEEMANTVAGISGFIILIIGIFASIVSATLIDGFGELVENSAKTRRCMEMITEVDLDKIQKSIAHLDNTLKSDNDTNIQKFSNESRGTQEQQESPQLSVAVQKPNTVQSSQLWKCPNCGTVNSAERTECYKCYTKVKLKSYQ